MDKKKVIEEIESYLVDELTAILGQTSEETEKARELKALLLMYKFLPVREYGSEDVVCPGALVELDLSGTRAHYFIAPQGGGLIANVEGQPVQVITPQSPLGEVVLGCRVGDTVPLESRGGIRHYQVVSIS